MTEPEPARLSIRTARGLMLGLLLGDALGAAQGELPEKGPIAAGAGGQLACWTVEGLIRAHVRGMHKGITTPSGVTWYAYRRWAALRGDVPATGQDDGWWRDSGWLVHVPALAHRRGSAPATVAAIRAGSQGSLERPVGSSLGAHALTRTLPASLCDWWNTDAGTAAELAALTHAGAAITTAALGSDLVAGLSRGDDIDAASAHAQRTLSARHLPALELDLPQVVSLGFTNPRDAGVLRRLASNATASSALAGGVYAAVDVNRRQVPDALVFAASAGDGGHAAAVAGALLGVIHGPDALPIDWVARLELVWPGDTLIRDLVQQVTENPSGGEYAPASDPHWLTRYPGA